MNEHSTENPTDRAPSRYRFLRTLALTVALILSLLVFPAYLPWMAAGWLILATFFLFRGQSGWLPLAACLVLVVAKGPAWLPGTLVFLEALAVSLLAIAAIAWWKSSPSQRLWGLRTIYVAIWALWVFFCYDYSTAGQASAVPAWNEQRSVVCLGDSLSADPKHGSYAEVLQARVKAPVINLALPGISTEQALKLLPELRQARPQVVVVELGGHDYNQGEPRAQTKANLEKIITTAKEAGAQVVLMEIPRGFICDPYFGLERELARKHDLQLISDSVIRNLVLWGPQIPPGMWFQDERLSYDGLHPNDAGNRWLADHVAAAIARMYGGEAVETSPNKRH